MFHIAPVPPTPQVNHELNCYHKYEGNEGEESYQDEYRGGFCHEVKGQRYGVEYKGGKNQEVEERGGGMCPVCGREEEFCSTIWVCSEERYELFFTFSVFEKEEVDKEVDETISDLPTTVQGELLNIDGDPFCEGYGIFVKRYVFVYIYIYIYIFE